MPIIRLPVCILLSLHLAVVSTTRAQAAPRLERVGSIGCAECGGPTQFATINDVVLTDSGNVLVVGSDAPMLRLFDRTGRVIWTAGRDGAGPGEYRRAMRAVVGPAGIQVVDMTLRRVTRLQHDGQFISAASIGGFPASVAGRPQTGEMVILTDNFRGTKTLHRWTFGDSGKRFGDAPQPAEQAGVIFFPSSALAPNGDIAFLADGNEYRIRILAPDGASLREIRREIPRVRRTPGEIAALERRRQRAGERAAAEVGRGRGAPPPLRAAGSDELKPHIAIDGLRFDNAGRLWVRTMRGDETRTVLDLFAPHGRFLGELVVPATIGAFSVAGRWLAADTEAPDGTRVVTLWEIR